MRLHELLVEGYKEAEIEFSKSSTNPTQVKDLIAAYKTLVTKNQVTGNERNIDYWRKQGFNKFSQFVLSNQDVPTKTEIKRSKRPGKSIFLHEDDTWLIVVPLDKEASCFHGKNSDWCTTKPKDNTFEKYFYRNKVTLIYCLNKQTGGMWAIAASENEDEDEYEDTLELFDKNDNSISEEEFKRQTGFDASNLVNKAHSRTNWKQIDTHRKPKEYRNEKGQLHRTDGPAVIHPDGSKQWYINGQLHREDGAGPASIDSDGTKKWYKHGVLHREDGPAVNKNDRQKDWYINGQLHREDGPAVEYTDGKYMWREWYINGQLHREDGPAVEHPIDAEGNYSYKWYLNGFKYTEADYIEAISSGEY